MRRGLIVAIINIVFVVTDLWPAAATQQLRMIDLMTPDSVLRWINGYRQKPDPSNVPDVVKALSRMSAFKDPEQAGPYLGFIAGVIGTHQDRAEELIGKMFPLPEENHWVIVRAIAYSGHPEWKRLLGGGPPKDAPPGIQAAWTRMLDFVEREASRETREEFLKRVVEHDAYFLVDAQRGGDGDCPVRHLWFHYDSLQFIEASPWNTKLSSNDPRKRPVEYVKKPILEMDEEL